MKIEHIAIWTKDLENLKDFYVTFFKAKANTKYSNLSNAFESYFLTFDSGARLELMRMPLIPENTNNVENQYQGIIHMAFSLGSQEKVEQLTQELGNYGCRILKDPRVTGDGYYESVILDPEGNRLELIV